MNAIYGSLFFLFFMLAAGVFLYIFLVNPTSKKKGGAKPKAKSSQKAKPRLKPVSPRNKSTEFPISKSAKLALQRGELPPEVPRDINTIKIIVEEDVDLVVGIVRKWLRER